MREPLSAISGKSETGHQPQYRGARAACWLLVGVLGLAGCAAPGGASGPTDSVPVKPASEVRRLVPAAQLERSAAQQFEGIKRQAAQKNALLPDNDPQVGRLRAIASRLQPQAYAWTADARRWQWEVIVLRSDQINAFCMPGGKIAFFTGILTRLNLTDDETDADLVGLDLAARAGFDPRAAISLWRKMQAQSKGAPPQWLSTHPSGGSRIDEISRVLPRVLPLYAQAIGTSLESLPEYPPR